MLKMTLLLFLMVWINMTISCIKHPPHKPRISVTPVQMKKVEKLIEEVRRKQEVFEEEQRMLEEEQRLYEEEQKMLLQEPEYFQLHSSSNSSSTDPVEYDEDDAAHGDDYPDFPPLTQDNSSVPDYKDPDMQEDEYDVYDPRFENIYDEYLDDYLYQEYIPVPSKSKRDTSEVINGIVESGEKLLSGNVVGSVTTFIRSLAKPIFSYFIHSNNDHAMKKFTSRILPETKFRDTAGAHLIRQAANEGDGEGVWHQISNKPSYWNPRSTFIQDKFHKSKTHIECRRNVPIMDKNLVHRLKSVSLMMTSLMTSLHDTTIADLNLGFKKASDQFSNIHKTTGKILNHTIYNPEIDLIIDILKDTAVIVELMQEEMADKTDLFVELALNGAGILGVLLLGFVLTNHIKKSNLEAEAVRGELAELKKLMLPVDVQETEEDKTRRAVVTAVREAMDAMAGQVMVQQQHMDPLNSGVLQVGNRAIRHSTMSAAHPRGIPLTYQQ